MGASGTTTTGTTTYNPSAERCSSCCDAGGVVSRCGAADIQTEQGRCASSYQGCYYKYLVPTLVRKQRPSINPTRNGPLSSPLETLSQHTTQPPPRRASSPLSLASWIARGRWLRSPSTITASAASAVTRKKGRGRGGSNLSQKHGHLRDANVGSGTEMCGPH